MAFTCALSGDQTLDPSVCRTMPNQTEPHRPGPRVQNLKPGLSNLRSHIWSIFLWIKHGSDFEKFQVTVRKQKKSQCTLTQYSHVEVRRRACEPRGTSNTDGERVGITLRGGGLRVQGEWVSGQKKSLLSGRTVQIPEDSKHVWEEWVDWWPPWWVKSSWHQGALLAWWWQILWKESPLNSSRWALLRTEKVHVWATQHSVPWSLCCSLGMCQGSIFGGICLPGTVKSIHVVTGFLVCYSYSVLVDHEAQPSAQNILREEYLHPHSISSENHAPWKCPCLFWAWWVRWHSVL